MDAINPFRRVLPAILLILLAGILVYANTFQVPFVLDDQITILRDPFVHDLDNFRPGAPESKLEHPRWLGYLSFALNYHFGGLDVTGYHVVNLLIHLAAALLVYALLHLTFRTPYFQNQLQGSDSQPSTFNLQPSAFIPLFAAMLFVVHPVQTQAVTYIVQRMTSQAVLFYLLSVVLYVQARLRLEEIPPAPPLPKGGVSVAGGEKGASPFRKWGSRGIFALLLSGSVLSALLAMKTKEIAFTLPLAVALYEACFFRGAWKRRLLCLLPLLATFPIVPMSVLATGQSTGQSTGDVLSDMSQQTLVHGRLSNLDYLFTQFRVIVTYLRLLVLPFNQNLDYDYPVYTTFFTPPVFLSFLFLAALFALAVYLFFASRPRSTLNPQPSTGDACVAPTSLDPQLSTFNDPALRLIAFGILWFFLTLAVESSLISIADVIVEHRLYLPGVGAAAAFAGAFWLMTRKFALAARGKLPVLLAALLVLGLGVAAYQRNHVWGDAVRLWQDVAAKSPNKVRPYNNLGVALTNAGRLSEAMGVLSRAIEMEPSHPHAYNNLGRVYILSGQSSAALPLLRMAIRLDLDYEDAYINLAAALNQERRFSETLALLEPNLGLLGERVEVHYHLGVAYAFLGNREAARRKLAIVSQSNAEELATDLIRLLGRDAHQAF